jgi:alpha-ketoglutarate-dependent taurine dioxygenase
MKIQHISSYGDIDISRIHQHFLEDGVVVLRGFDMSFDQQRELMMGLGDLMLWYPNHKYPHASFAYIENHEHTLEMRSSPQLDERLGIGADDVLVEWHMEHIGFPNPAVGASWNMRTFTCSNEYGKTLFVDAVKLFAMLGKEDADFLVKCLFQEDVGLSSKIPPIWICPIRKHLPTGKMMVYISPVKTIGFGEKLRYAQTHKPTEDERARFDEICTNLATMIKTNIEIRTEHKWQQHDVVIADLSRQYHAVTGGFRSSERNFEGIWAHGLNGDKFGVAATR